jgi:hypothetical protein
MDITIDAESVEIRPMSGNQVCVELSSIDKDDLYGILKELDISKIVEALGVFDLLEEIGEDAITKHLALEEI